MAKKRPTSKRDQSDMSKWIAGQPPGRRRGLRTALSSLRKAFAARESESLLWWHHTGGLVAEFFPDGGRQYGSNVMELLARDLGAADEKAIRSMSNTLWQTRTIAKTLTLREAKSWAAKRNSKGRPLSAYHISTVAVVEDREQRTELLDTCLAEGWGVTRLRAEVQNRFGKKRSRGGRKPLRRETPSPLVALRDVQLTARQWMADHKIWFVGCKSALGHVSKNLHTDELYEALGEAADALIEMQAAVDAGLECLKGLATDVERKLIENRKR
jgi:hypothetical protein